VDKTFDTPRVDDPDQAVRRTVALFLNREKPQLFPRLAASFIRHGEPATRTMLP
jgi:hypothetical protein